MRRDAQVTWATIAMACFVMARSASASTICEVSFSIGASEPLEVLDIAADYSAVNGTFSGSLDSVTCTALTDDTAFMARDTCSPSDNYCYHGDGRVLFLILSRAAGFQGPKAVASCSFITPEGQAPTPDQFQLQVRTATALATGGDVAETPEISITGLDCSAQ